MLCSMISLFWSVKHILYFIFLNMSIDIFCYIWEIFFKRKEHSKHSPILFILFSAFDLTAREWSSKLHLPKIPFIDIQLMIIKMYISIFSFYFIYFMQRPKHSVKKMFTFILERLWLTTGPRLCCIAVSINMHSQF